MRQLQDIFEPQFGKVFLKPCGGCALESQWTHSLVAQSYCLSQAVEKLGYFSVEESGLCVLMCSTVGRPGFQGWMIYLLGGLCHLLHVKNCTAGWMWLWSQLCGKLTWGDQVLGFLGYWASPRLVGSNYWDPVSKWNTVMKNRVVEVVAWGRALSSQYVWHCRFISQHSENTEQETLEAVLKI